MKLLLMLSAIFSIQVWALELPQDPSDSPISTIEDADIICEREGGMIAINVKDKRFWQGEPGETEGLELTIESMERLRCGPNCWDIRAALNIGGTKVRYQFITNYDWINKSLSGTLKLGSDEILFSCQAINKKAAN